MSRRPCSPARRLAHGVLVRVGRDGAYADRALEGALQRSELEAPDRHLATQLVYGTLRNQGWLDFLLDRLLERPLVKLPMGVRVSLELGAYQILELRIPNHAAVNESVGLVGGRDRALAGVVNAVLRRLIRLRDAGELPDPAALLTDPIEALAVRTSQPAWVLRQIAADRGEAAVRAWALANNATPPLVLRVNPLRLDRDSLLQRLQGAGLQAEVPVQFAAPELEAVQVSGAGEVRRMPGFADGDWTVQDPGAQLVGQLAAAEPGQTVLDACAAPGGKAMQLAEQMQDRGFVLALDVHPARVRLITAAAERLGLRCVKPAAADAADPAALKAALERHGQQAVDLALVDAPCSGLGTLRRNPELRRRRQEDLSELCALQRRLLDSVASVVRPGGALVYAVCTVTRQEGDEQLAAFLRRHDDFRLVRPASAALQPFVDERGVLRTWTDRHDCDSFFAARLERRG